MSEEKRQSDMAAHSGQAQPFTRLTVLIVALPHLLFASNFVIAALSVQWPVARDVFSAVLVAVLVAALFVAWRRHWPLWSGSWAGYWLMVPFMLVTRFLPQLELLALALPLLILAIAPRRPLVALLALMPPLLLLSRAWTFELVSGGNQVWIGVWLLLTLVSVVIVWRATVRTGVLLLVGFHLLTGAVFAAAKGMLPYRFADQMGPRQPLTAQAFANDFVPLTLALVSLTLTLALLHLLWRMRRWDGGDARRSHALLLGGMALTLGAVLTLRSLPQPTMATIALAALVGGLLLSLWSAVALGRVVLSNERRRRRAVLTSLLAAFAPLVILPQATLFARGGAYSASTQAQIALGYVGTLLWVLGALWVLVSEDAHSDSGVASSILATREGGADSTFQTALHS